jgi:hypothetical protein
MYGVFEDEQGITHVAPCNEEMELCYPHVLSPQCCCEPYIEIDEEGTVTINHEQVH